MIHSADRTNLVTSENTCANLALLLTFETLSNPAGPSFSKNDDTEIILNDGNNKKSASTTMLGVQPLLGLPFLDPASQAIAASASAGALSGGVLEEGEGGMAGLRVGEGGKVLTAQESLALMLANIKGLGEHKVGAVLSLRCSFGGGGVGGGGAGRVPMNDSCTR